MAQGPANTLESLDKIVKEQFAPNYENAIPEFAIIQSKITWKDRVKFGDLYRVPVILRRELGFTQIARGDGLVTYNAANAGKMRPAEIKPHQLHGRSQVDYGTIFATQDVPQAAFGSGVGVVMENLHQSARHLQEIFCLYGQSLNGIGTLDATHSADATTLKISKATWATGIWHGMEGESGDINGFYVHIFTPGTPYTFQANARIIGVNPDADPPTLTVEYFDTSGAVIGSPSSVSAAGDVLFPFGSFGNHATPFNPGSTVDLTTDRSKWRHFAGLEAWANNGHGSPNPATIANISGAQYQLWRASRQSAGGVDLSIDTILSAFSKVSMKGAGGKYTFVCSPITYAKLLADQGALRRYDRSDSPTKYEIGAESIVFYTQTGSVEILGHAMVKQGHGFGFAPKDWMRFGTTDVTFDTQKMEGISGPTNQFFLPLPTQNGVEFRCYSEQCLFTSKPARLFEIYNIVNSPTP